MAANNARERRDPGGGPRTIPRAPARSRPGTQVRGRDAQNRATSTGEPRRPGMPTEPRSCSARTSRKPIVAPNSAETPIDPPSSAIPPSSVPPPFNRPVRFTNARNAAALLTPLLERDAELFPDKLRTGRAMIGVLRQAAIDQRRQLARQRRHRANQVAEPARSPVSRAPRWRISPRRASVP